MATSKAGTIDQNLIPANAQHRYEVRYSDLPLSCPMPGMYLWNSHPKVYLPIEETGEAMCPYCGAAYYLRKGSE
ncbi:MAG TPA: zinc-finger domain-containing protein [Woeseiaceae bacterium]|nr:zinc-finger domain-containing protein [Woeseiaceae bacterium]